MNFKSFFLTTLAVGIGVSLANGNLMNTINTASEKAQEQMMVAVDPMMNGANRLLDTDGSEVGYVNCEKGSIKLDGWDRWATAEEAAEIAIQNDNALQLYGVSTAYAYATSVCVMNGMPFGNAYRSMPIR